MNLGVNLRLDLTGPNVLGVKVGRSYAQIFSSRGSDVNFLTIFNFGHSGPNIDGAVLGS
jgi:hypothetical protein